MLPAKPQNPNSDQNLEHQYLSSWSQKSKPTISSHDNNPKVTHYSLETLNYDSQYSTTTNKLSNISEIPYQNSIVSGEVKIFPAKRSDLPSENTTLKSLSNRGRSQQQTFMIEHQEEPEKVPKNYFSDFGDLQNLIDSAKKESYLPEVTRDGKIVAKLSRERGPEPFLANDHSSQLNEKRRIKKINAKISRDSPGHRISSTIILDLEAELGQMN